MMEVFKYGNPGASVVLIQPVDDHDLSFVEDEIKAIKSLTDADFRLVAFKVNDWNSDLSPWKAPPVFGKDDFGEGAAATLDEILEIVSDKTKVYYIGGYSLAGLFALWAAYQTDTFGGVAAASPSVWFPGFTEFMEENEIKSRAVYLSLGDKESKARNPVMATVGEQIQKVHSILKERGVVCTLEWNEGNHFKDADVRTAKAFAWLVNGKGSIYDPATMEIVRTK